MRSPEQVPDVEPGDASSVAEAANPEQLRRQGLLWLVAGFAVCPCHLPFALAAIGALIGGTAVGDLVTGNAVATGIVLGAVTAVAYLKGWRLLSSADACATGACPAPGERRRHRSPS